MKYALCVKLCPTIYLTGRSKRISQITQGIPIVTLYSYLSILVDYLYEEKGGKIGKYPVSGYLTALVDYLDQEICNCKKTISASFIAFFSRYGYHKA